MMKSRLYLLVPLFMLIWASCQMFVVKSQNLSFWRGGGFGMYAGFHPVQRDAWIWSDDGSVPVRYTKQSEDHSQLYQTVRPHLTFPRPAVLERDLGDTANETPRVSKVLITGLEFDLDSLTLSRKTILEVSPGESP